jgi:hypothetical protein
MGFDIVGLAPKNDTGRYFRNNVWWWRPLQALITILCADELTEEETRELGFNDGYKYSAEKAALIAERLAEVAANDEMLDHYRGHILELLSDSYKDCWDRDNVVEFIEFLKNSGGFEVW